MQQAIYKGLRDYEEFQSELEQGKNIVVKFLENFFISKLMDNSNKVGNFL